MQTSQASTTADPLQILGGWLEDGRHGAAAPSAMTLATATGDGRPSARVVSLKRLEERALVFTSSLWTRKVDELRGNPAVAAVFHWPSPGRQARIEGRAELAERELAEELWAERPRSHRLQVLASRQGEEIENLATLRTRLEALERGAGEGAIPCPEEWGAVRIRPETVELWEEAEDRIHDRRFFTRHGDGWRESRLAP